MNQTTEPVPNFTVAHSVTRGLLQEIVGNRSEDRALSGFLRRYGRSIPLKFRPSMLELANNVVDAVSKLTGTAARDTEKNIRQFIHLVETTVDGPIRQTVAASPTAAPPNVETQGASAGIKYVPSGSPGCHDSDSAQAN